MRLFTLIILILTSCVNGTMEQPIDNLSLLDVGQKLNGHWRLVETETRDGQLITNSDPDNLEFYEFEGLSGVNTEMTDNHDGSFGIMSCSPFCELKENGNQRTIVYTGLAGEWELEITKLSDIELVLSDSGTRWTYERAKIEEW